jgi:hypothetical protein
MKFISIDPSLSNTAIVWGEIVDGNIIPKNWKIVASKKSTVKIPVMQDRLNRIKDIFAAIDEILETNSINEKSDLSEYDWTKFSQGYAFGLRLTRVYLKTFLK